MKTLPYILLLVWGYANAGYVLRITDKESHDILSVERAISYEQCRDIRQRYLHTFAMLKLDFYITCSKEDLV